MAIGRYDQFGVTDPTSNFFKLDYQVLAQPILKADQEYKQLDEAYHQFNQQLASKEVLPKDVPLLGQRVKELETEEAKLRQSVNGDILDPRYQEGLRTLVGKQTKDEFYKKAAWNLNVYKQHQDYKKAHTEKYGVAPAPWQDPTGTFFDQYENADSSGFATNDAITPVFPYQEKAVEFAMPMIKKKLDTQEWKEFTKTGADGVPHKFLYSKTGAAVTPEQIKEVVKLSTIGEGSAQWEQLRTIYESSPELQQQYQDFNAYYNDGILESVGKSLGYEYEDVSGLTRLDDYTNSSSGSTRTSSLREKMVKAEKIDTKLYKGATTSAPGATNPLFYPNYDVAQKARSYYQSQADDILNGYWKTDETGKRIKVPDLQTSIYQQLGVTPNNNKGISVQLSPMENSNELGVYVAYQSKDGSKRTVNILSGEAIARREEMPDELKNNLTNTMLMASEKAAQYTAAKHQQSEIDRFSNRAAVSAFGADAAKKIEKAGFASILSRDEQVKLNTNDSYRVGKSLMGKIERGEGIVKQDITSITGVATSSSLFGENASIKAMKDLSSILGVDEKSWMVKGATNEQKVDLFVANVNQARKSGLINRDDVIDLDRNLTDAVSADILSERKDGKMKKYTKYWEQQWTRGLDADMNPMSDKDNPTGTKLSNKKIYYYNQTNTTGQMSSEKFWTGGKQLIAAQLGYRVDGDWNQNATYSNMQVFNYGSNKAIDEKKYKSLADPANWDLIGITVDDEGFNILIKDKTQDGKAEDSWLEIRNHEMVVDYMVQAGMGPQLVFDTTKQMLAQFSDQSQSPVQSDINQPRGVGRTSGAVVLQSEIGGGVFTRPIERLETAWVDPVTKQSHPAGTFKYYSLSKEKYVYTGDPLDVTLEYLQDRDTTINGSNKYQAFSENTFGGKVSIPKEMTAKGNNTLSTNMLTILNEGILNDPLLPGTLNMSSATRDKQHMLSKENPSSPHILGNAVDFSVLKGSSLHAPTIEFFKGKAAELSDVARIVLEFPPNDPRAAQAAQTYGKDFVKIEDHATGPHIHIEYINR